VAAKRLKKQDVREKTQGNAVPTTPQDARALLEKLRVSEIRYRRLFETAQDGILLLDAETGRITDVNPFLLDLLGYSYKEIVGKKLWEIGPFVDRTLAKQAFEKLQNDRYIRYEDLPLETATGTRIQVEFVSNAYPVDGKKVIQCNIRDITERKLAEDVAQGRNVGKDFALDVGELGAWRLDLATGKAWRSPQHDQIFGYPTLLPEWTYEMFLSHVLAEDHDAVAESFSRALSGNTDWDFTCRIRRKDGEVRWIWAKGRPELGKRGEPVALYGLVQDITERKAAAASLVESELKYRQVVENASEAIFVAQHGRIVFLNPATCALIGDSSEEIMARPFTEFVHPDDRDMVLERQHTRTSGKKPRTAYAFRVVRADGTIRWGEVRAVPIDWQGKPASLGLLSDVTERKQVELESKRLLESQLAVNRIMLSLGALMDLPAILRALHNEVRTLLDADGFFVSRYHKDTGLMTALFAFEGGVERDVSTFPPIPLAPEGKGMQSQVLRTGQPLNIPNWIEQKRKMETVYHIEPDGTFTPPPEDEREECIKSALLVPMMLQGEPIGVLQVQSIRLNAYSEEDKALVTGLANVGAVSIQNALLVRAVREGLEGTIRALARTTEMRDPYTAGHQERVARLACVIAEKMGLGEERMESLRVAGLLHDVGKVSVPSEILSKPSALTPLEFGLVKEHVRVGFDVLKGVVFPWPVVETVLQHHERLDGSGYPCGLKGEAINLGARILAVADVVEAMASHRPYRPALGIDAALKEIRERQGKLYDSEAVEACNQVFADGFEFTRAGMHPSP
jgi:PAS domain S-box-containing protein/putative nucleotidyltransferase with HDIG domain